MKRGLETCGGLGGHLNFWDMKSEMLVRSSVGIKDYASAFHVGPCKL